MSTTTRKEGKAAVEKEGFDSKFVDTFWDQYEQSLERFRKLRERREEAYLNTVNEVVRFNQEFRGSLANLLQTTRETSSELVKGVTGNLVKKGEEQEVIRPDMKEQYEEVSERLEQLAMTPIAAGLDLLQRFEERLLEDSENYVNYVKERRNSWQKVTDEYAKAARENHHKLVERLEETVKVLVNSK